MHIVHFVNFYQVLEKHEDYVAKKSGLSAEVSILELFKYECHELVEILSMSQNLRSSQCSHVV